MWNPVKRLAHYLINRTPKKLKQVIPYSLKHRVNQFVQKGDASPSGVEFAIDFKEYSREWEKQFGHRLEEYFKMHKLRYYELLNSLQLYIKGKENPRVLEIGVSEFALFYKHYFPDIHLVTLDRPEEQNGFTADFCIQKARADRHYHCDLNQQRLNSQLGSPPLGKFDYIICTEVLEHLVVNPVEFILDLIGLLNHQGFLYLTTPNFFRYDNMTKIKKLVNPQMVFPGFGNNQDAHHHFREYEMNEMVGFVEEAGGEVVEHYYSSCWDAPDLLASVLKEHPQQKSNLVFVIQQKNQK